MYPEFIAIYVMLAVVIVMLGVLIFLVLKSKNNGTRNTNNFYASPQQPKDPYYGQQYQAPYQEQYPQYGGGSVVFCKQCATQFDSSQAYCPQCGTRR